MFINMSAYTYFLHSSLFIISSMIKSLRKLFQYYGSKELTTNHNSNGI